MKAPCSLTDLPNIGGVLAAELQAIGIYDRAHLVAMGSVEAARRLSQSGRVDCFNMLMALEGAIRGVRWHAIPEKEKQEIKRRFDALSGQG